MNNGRWLKNTVNNRVLAWTKVLSEKETMVECDTKGNIKLDNVPVGDDKILIALQDKAAECNVLRKENSILKLQLKEHERIYGKLEDQLPEKTVKQVIESAPEVVEEVDSDVEEATDIDYTEIGNKKLLGMIKERGLKRPFKMDKESLIAVLAKADSKGE